MKNKKEIEVNNHSIYKDEKRKNSKLKGTEIDIIKTGSKEIIKILISQKLISETSYKK